MPSAASLARGVAFFIASTGNQGVQAQLFPGETVEEACAAAVTYGDPLCINDGTLHIANSSNEERSCSYCDCQDGWAGVDCGRCMNISVCPDKITNGTSVPATNCSSDSLIPTEEESAQVLGKVFSCTCGGGGDAWSAAICGLQPDTLVEFTIKGSGSDADPANATFTLYAGVEITYLESWPGEFDYYYPIVWQGSADNCKITRGSCLEVEDTNIGDEECVRYDCENTQGSCPPEGYPVCDGFPACKNDEGQTYQVHRCIGVPAESTALTIACQDQQTDDGEFICYYQQPGEFAPISISCSVGSCLYEGTTVVDVVTREVEEAPLSITGQSWLLVAGAAFLLLLFWLFALCTDWGSAKRAPRSWCRKKSSPSKPGASNGHLEGGGGAVGGEAVAAATSTTVQNAPHPSAATTVTTTNNATATNAVGGFEGDDSNSINGQYAPRRPLLASLRTRGFGFGAGGATITNAPPASAGTAVVATAGTTNGGGNDACTVAPQQPALLEWRELSYTVKVPGKYPGAKLCAGALPVLISVSGYAGPRDFSAAPATSDGAVAASTMTGILGPSGAGKSSLIDLLAGRTRRREGRTGGYVSLVSSGGAEASVGGGGGGRGTSSVSQIRRVAGYVPQEDVLPGTLSCYEHLMFHARLRMPRAADHTQRRARALEVLEKMGLTRVADARIGDELTRGLSGGERRRLSIAAELMASPALLFLDEPTTGLDAATALRVMALLRDVANGGTTVLCSLHQPRPRMLNLLDKVMLLSRGQVAYFGSPSDAKSFFSSIGRPFPAGQPHPADAMLTLCSREDGSALPSLFQRSPYSEGTHSASGDAATLTVNPLSTHNKDLDLEGTSLSRHSSLRGPPLRPAEPSEAESGFSSEQGRCSMLCCCGSDPCGSGGDGAIAVPPKAGFLVQTEALSRRLLLRAVRHPLLLMLHFGGAVAMAVCLGTIFQGKLEFTFDGAQSRLGVLFFLLLYLSLLSLTSLPVWREDRRLFLTESMGGAYGHLSYFLSVVLADILLVRVIPPLVLAVVAYPLMGLNDFSDAGWTLLWFALILVLSNIAVALGAMGVGALGLALDLSNLLGGLMVLIFILFSRFLLNENSIPAAWRWLRDVTPLGYAYESLLINEFYDPLGQRPYTINGSECSPDLPVVKPLGSTILKAFEFSTSRTAMRSDVAMLAILSAAFTVLSFLTFFIFTRTGPQKIGKPGRGSFSQRFSRPTSLSGRSKAQKLPPDGESDETPQGPAIGAAAPSVDNDQNGRYAADGTVAMIAMPPGETPSTAGEHEQSPVLLSWEGVRLSIPVKRSCWSRLRKRGNLSDGRLTVLNGVSGFAGPVPSALQAGRTAVGGDGMVPHMGGDGTDGNGQRSPVAAHQIPVNADSHTTIPATNSSSKLSGSVTAIMGPSGAGKTSLLNVLAGRRGEAASGKFAEIAGKLRVNGEFVDPHFVKRVSGYVTQEDVLPETLTCYEHLMFHAELRMRGVNKDARRARVMEVLHDLNIVRIKDSRIGGGLSRGISGGEKRRLSIGTELLTRPPLLFLDEPTTGLDSSTALTVMQLLAKAAGHGTTILCSLHQPRPQVLGLLDQVLLLSRGQVAYFGAPSAAASYFDTIGRPLFTAGNSRTVTRANLPEIDEGNDGTANSHGLERVGSSSALLGARSSVSGFLPGGGNEGQDEEGEGLLGAGDAMLDLIGDAEIAEDDGTAAGVRDGGGGRSPAGLVVMDPVVLLAKLRTAERNSPPPLIPSQSRSKTCGMCVAGGKSRAPPTMIQLKALGGRALLNVARDPYLATLHLLLTPVVGVIVGSLFEDLRRLNSETAGVQGRLGLIFFVVLFLSFLCLTSLAAWVKQMHLSRHERAAGVYSARAHLITSYLADAVVCRVLPPIILGITIRPLAGLRYGSLPGLTAVMIVFNLCLAGVLAACGTGARSGQEALAMGCLVVLFSALLSGYLVSRDDLPAFWSALVWISPIAHAFEALVINEFGEYGAVFRLSTKISGYTAYTPYLTGDNILSCFGFEEARFATDLGLLAAVGAAGLVLAYGLIFRRS